MSVQTSEQDVMVQFQQGQAEMMHVANVDELADQITNKDIRDAYVFILDRFRKGSDSFENLRDMILIFNRMQPQHENMDVSSKKIAKFHIRNTIGAEKLQLTVHVYPDRAIAMSVKKENLQEKNILKRIIGRLSSSK